MKKIIITIIFLSFAHFIFSQKEIKGIVTNTAEERLPSATVQWKNTKSAVVTNEKGEFMISSRSKTDTLLVTYTGYEPAEVVVEPNEKSIWIEIKGIKSVSELVVKSDRPDNFVSTLEKRHIEQITSCELRKAPCCNLAGSFETNGSVDISSPNAVTGATEIQLLGLRGIYTQLSLLKRPTFYGLAYPFALEFYPGTWLDGISISKGASSVEQGAQSLTGQINVDLVKPAQDKALFLNVYESSLGTFEANVHLNKRFKNNWSGGVLFHFDDNQNVWDHDKDGFVNMPLKRQYNAMTRLIHNGKKWYSQLSVHALQDNRQGGQVAVENNAWKVRQDMRRLDVGGTFGYMGFEKSYNALALIYGLTMHETDELYGKNTHVGTQNSFYTNLIYQTIIGTSDHSFKTGASFQMDDYKERVNDVNLDRKDVIAGVFAEYDYARPVLGEDFTDWGITAGIRADNHQKFGTIASPRLNLKYNFSQNSIIRASAGRGWRVANIIPENLNALASNRNLDISKDLKPEDGWNMGVNFSNRFKVLNKNASFSTDIYHTAFSNQIIVDFDKDIKKVFFYNLNGRSYSTSMMGVFTCKWSDFFDFKIAYKFNDVKTTLNDQLNRPPLFAAHRGLLTLDFKNKDRTWLVHISNHLVGAQRLANRSNLPIQYHTEHTSTSPAYLNVNMQITKLLGRWEIYFGGENLTNYIQHNPIVSSQNPFGDYFDASQVWGPLMGIRGFVGVRYSIEHKEE
jgi:outer membrane cobalamin receptor